MDHADERAELTMLGDVVSRRDDVVFEHGKRRICVRRTKTGEAFIPRTLFVSLMPWDIVIATMFALFRRMPTWFSKQWQVGVFFQRNVDCPGSEVGLLTYGKFNSLVEADLRRGDLIAAVERGDFDRAAELPPNRGSVARALRKIAALD